MTLREKSDIPASVVVDLLKTAKVDPFVIFDAKTHEIYMESPAIAHFWKPVKPFEPGIKFEDYFICSDEKNPLLIDN